jgi:hypothetical protein
MSTYPARQGSVAGGGPSRTLPAPFLALPATLLALLLVVTAWLALSGALHEPRGSDPARLSQASLEEKSGVRVVRVAVTAAGGLVELTYQVVDADRAASVHDPSAPPAIVDEKTGRKVNRPFMGHMPHGPVRAGATYYVVFENYNHVIQRDRPVAVELGGGRLEGIAVR